jgi:hypothetical protein
MRGTFCSAIAKTQIAHLPSGFFASWKLANQFGDLRLYQKNLVAVRILKIKPLYA